MQLIKLSAGMGHAGNFCYPALLEALFVTAVVIGDELALPIRDRKSTRLNSSHVAISYAVFCFVALRSLHSFPTRRSSDLSMAYRALNEASAWAAISLLLATCSS